MRLPSAFHHGGGGAMRVQRVVMPARGVSPARSHWRLVAHVQVVGPVSRIVRRPTVQLGLDFQYPAFHHLQHGRRLVGIHQRPPSLPVRRLLTCWSPSPCTRLSRARTTTGPPPHPVAVSRRRTCPPGALARARHADGSAPRGVDRWPSLKAETTPGSRSRHPPRRDPGPNARQAGMHGTPRPHIDRWPGSSRGT